MAVDTTEGFSTALAIRSERVVAHERVRRLIQRFDPNVVINDEDGIRQRVEGCLKELQ